MSDFIEEMAQKQAALDAADAAAKAKGTLVGRYIQHPFADSYAIYTITGVRGNQAHIQVADIGDAWVLPAWGKSTYIPLKKAREMVASRDVMNRFFDKTADWWAQQKIGATVHYQSSAGQFVRGVIVEHEGEKKMRPTALVGDWQGHDLPRRNADGSVYYSYHAQGIREGRVTQPNASNMVEYPEHRLRGPDPRGLPPISVEPPAMTPEQVKLAEVAKLHKAVVAALEYQHDRDPTKLAEEIKLALKRAKRLLAE